MADIRLESKTLFDALVKKVGGWAPVLHYIEREQEIASTVTKDWLNGNRHLSDGLQKRIFNCLKSVRSDDFPDEPQPVVIVTPPTAEHNEVARPRRKDTYTLRKSKEERMRDNVANLIRMGVIIED